MEAGTLPPRRILSALAFRRHRPRHAGACRGTGVRGSADLPARDGFPVPARPACGRHRPRVRLRAGHVPGALPMHDRLARPSHPVNTVADTARETDADLIVMGRHGRGLVGRVVLGSVASGIVRHAAVPVLLVRTPGASIRGTTVVVEVNLGQGLMAVVGRARRLTDAGGASLPLLHVLPITDHASLGHGAGGTQPCRSRRQPTCPPMSAPGLTVRCTWQNPCTRPRRTRVSSRAGSASSTGTAHPADHSAPRHAPAKPSRAAPWRAV